jgi:hypothetical protein
MDAEAYLWSVILHSGSCAAIPPTSSQLGIYRRAAHVTHPLVAGTVPIRTPRFSSHPG